MVLSRYVTVLQGAGKTFRSNFLGVNVNHKESYHKKTGNVPVCAIHARSKLETSQNFENCHNVSTGKFRENIPSVKSNILEMTSAAATSCVSEISESDGFGNKYFTSDDNATENNLDESDVLPSALETCDRDISHIAPFHKPSFNFAAYANDSPMIQELAKLGVQLYKIEGKKNAMQILLRRNFDDMKPYIRFLHDSGVSAGDIGAFITKNPYIFTQDTDDLHTRIRYLRAHNFNREMIARILTKNPYWLMFKTNKIDERLGFFQQRFDLKGSQVRSLTVAQPRLITYQMKHITESIFAIKEEMGFDEYETKTILLTKPRLFMKSRRKIVEVFDYLHNTMKLSHEILSKQPIILTCRIERLRQRHKYLEALGRNQYDPTMPMYVSANAIVGGTDAEFCRDVAKTTVETYNLYLKSL